MFKSVLVTVDLEQTDRVADLVDVALHQLESDACALHLLAVVERFRSSLVGSFFPADFENKLDSSAKERLEELARGLDFGAVTPSLHVLHGTVYEEILRAAEKLEADMIVLGAYGPEHKGYLLGPNAARVVRHARQSVLVVRR